MSNIDIDTLALREAAEKATWGDWDSYKPHRGARGYEVRLSSQAIAQHVLKNNAEFIAAFNPKVALALLDELERNQQYIKRRDQENEDIALTVGKLRVELEAAKKRMTEQSAIVAAAEKLVRCKGRYHSELNYRALAKLFGVITPDLPPLVHENVHYADAAEVEITALRQRIAELEAREVTLPQRLQPGADGYDDWYVHSADDGEYLKADDVIAAIRAAGIKVKG
ncbi:ead/Ea22-like family protein [Salmonella enterica]|nr:ead/Ea22-like family protein [Salmonella enterica subsp. enterica serovar Carrau]EJJ4036897.1 ead/Ea22-like family protein [Salmonella enterica]EJJ4051237.1 ead/Ea22-like family protein [Salmonella enterica]EJJ4234682.1 ead/Ea22-like family protein [Salmonella enterica]EJJ4326852.1 ead/Ea22-like family protein [Salmonella enterica]